MKDERGITLAALIITVVVMIILTGVSITAGTESVNNTKLQGFYTQLEIIQKRVDDIAATNESYIDDAGNTIYLKERGSALTEAQTASLENILDIENITALASNFRYFTVQELNDELDLSEIEYNVYIDFDNRIVIAADGEKIGDTTYYVHKNTTYFVEQNANKNTGTIQSLTYSATKYDNNTCKVVVTPSNTIGDLNSLGYVKYKKTTSKYWETSANTVIVLEASVEYNIVYIDPNNNSIESTIKAEIDSNGNASVTEV